MAGYIFHIDVNSAFLSWSALKQLQDDPGAIDLRTIPSAVGGDVETRHGIITAKSIPAKKYGVQTGEPVVKALQKCPHLVLVKSDFATYRAYSRAFIEILREYTDRIEQVSIDEAYLDTEGLERRFGGEQYPINLARDIKDGVHRRLGFTVNVGISTNRLLAKMASDFSKPDKVHTLFSDEVPEKMWPLPIRELHGCGRATAEKLERIGIHTIGDAARAELQVLQSLLGEKGGIYISQSAKGISRAEVQTERDEAKSYSNETTTAFDITDSNYEKEALPILRRLSEKVSDRMQRDGVYAGTIDVSVKTDSFRRRSRQMKLKASTNDADRIYKTSARLLEELLRGKNGLFASGHGVRLIGVGGSNLDRGEYRQIGFAEALAEINAMRNERTLKTSEMAENKNARSRQSAVQAGGEAAEARRKKAAGARGKTPRDKNEKILQNKNEKMLQDKNEKTLRLQKMQADITKRFGANAIRKGAGGESKSL